MCYSSGMTITLPQITAVSPKWRIIRDECERAYADHVANVPYAKIRKPEILTPPGANDKLAKGTIPTYGLSLAPAGASGYQICPWRSAECEAACLGFTSGKSLFPNVRSARVIKTRQLIETPYPFMRQMIAELASAYDRHGGKFAFRSNVLSDIAWEHICPHIYLFAAHNYDYTKSYDRAMRNIGNAALRLTLSYSGHNWDQCRSVLENGGNVAAVFAVRKGKPLPTQHDGWTVIDGDENDNRFNDPESVIVGLRAKGGINTDSPFVIK